MSCVALTFYSYITSGRSTGGKKKSDGKIRSENSGRQDGASNGQAVSDKAKNPQVGNRWGTCRETDWQIHSVVTGYRETRTNPLLP